MADLREEYHTFQKEHPDESDVLKELDDLISDYDVRHETSLKDPFLTACFERIDPERNWEELVRDAENYENWWGKKKRRATALRMLMTLQIGWPEHKGLLEFDWKYLIGILYAIKASDDGVDQSEDHVPVTYPPDLDLELLERDLPERTVPNCDIPTILTFSPDIKNNAVESLAERSINPEANNHHVVYVIDCTPETEPERSAITSIRHYAQALRIGGKPLNDREAAAVLLNESQGLLYVGYSHEFPKRMNRHFKGKATGGANFMNLYKPKRLLDIDDYPSDEIAESEEIDRASELKRQTEWFVYQY
ncbi:hypothetical protein GJR96_08470 [Haloferax sp. MBLA0076]|uniref:Uncharacterized protein n=1 Tax=Haloferax litoreum TaxID=2666140 RepID=A0A6A8GGI8_9EURY|nr:MULTISPECIES: hypothetical protein [Haloferax]KAB1193476.1 hypothetical protein Hfx1148_08460 [Haloferax sp. CBA1148]MRX21989.1 hypothetical protein [Haloferax litoreum]